MINLATVVELILGYDYNAGGIIYTYTSDTLNILSMVSTCKVLRIGVVKRLYFCMVHIGVHMSAGIGPGLVVEDERFIRACSDVAITMLTSLIGSSCQPNHETILSTANKHSPHRHG
jgi:hypothetical protein